MAQLNIEIDDDLNAWVSEQAKIENKSKVAFVSGILIGVRNKVSLVEDGGASLSEEREQPPPHRVVTPDARLDAIKEIAITLDLLFERYFIDHPRLTLTDCEKEIAEERWDDVRAIRRSRLRMSLERA